MAGLINWKKVSPPAANPDNLHLYVGVDPADCKLYIKDDLGNIFKYQTDANVAAAIAAALTNYDLSTVVDSKISTAVNNLINGAGSALDTLNELATALGNDPNFATTITNALALKANTADLGALAFLNTVGTSQIDANAVTSTQIANNAVTSVKINNNVVTNSKLTDMPAQTIKGNDTLASGDPKDLTISETKVLLSLDQVNNTSDVNKPVSTAQSAAIAAAVTAHEAASDPHPQYLTSTEGNAAYQPVDGDLTAIAALAGAGFAVRTTTNTWATRSLTTPVGSGLAITNQDGVFGSPAFTNTDKGSTAVTTHEAAADPHPQYETSAEAQAKVDAHANLTNNPHSVTKAQVGLGNVDNTSDLNKPISTATQTALNGKANLLGGNTFTGTQQVNDGNLILRDENTAGDPYVWVVGSGGSGNKVGYRFTPFFGRTGGQAAEVGAIDDGNSSAHLLFYTAPTGSATSILERGRFNNDGSFGVGVGAVNAASALVQIDSTTRGFLPPRMTSAQRLAIASPAQGLVVYDTSLNALCTYTGTTWIYETTVRSASVSVSTTNVFATVPDLITASLEVGFYKFNTVIVMQSISTALGVGVRLSSVTATANVLGQWKFPESAALGTAAFSQWIQEANIDDATSLNSPFANQDFIVCGEGLLEIASPGTVAISFRSELFGSSVSVRQRSILSIRKVN